MGLKVLDVAFKLKISVFPEEDPLFDRKSGRLLVIFLVYLSLPRGPEEGSSRHQGVGVPQMVESPTASSEPPGKLAHLAPLFLPPPTGGVPRFP